MTPDELRSLVAAATPGPWGFVIRGGDEWWFGDGNEAVIYTGKRESWDSVAVMGCEEDAPDARLIALAPQLASLLADAMEAIRYAEDCISSPDLEYTPGKDVYDQHMMLGASRRLRKQIRKFAALGEDEAS